MYVIWLEVTSLLLFYRWGDFIREKRNHLLPHPGSGVCFLGSTPRLGILTPVGGPTVGDHRPDSSASFPASLPFVTWLGSFLLWVWSLLSPWGWIRLYDSLWLVGCGQRPEGAYTAGPDLLCSCLLYEKNLRLVVISPGKMRDSRADLDSSLSLKPSQIMFGLDVNPTRHVDMRWRKKCLLLLETELWVGLLRSSIGTIANRYKPQWASTVQPSEQPHHLPSALGKQPVFPPPHTTRPTTPEHLHIGCTSLTVVFCWLTFRAAGTRTFLALFKELYCHIHAIYVQCGLGFSFFPIWNLNHHKSD